MHGKRDDQGRLDVAEEQEDEQGREQYAFDGVQVNLVERRTDHGRVVTLNRHFHAIRQRCVDGGKFRLDRLGDGSAVGVAIVGYGEVDDLCSVQIPFLGRRMAYGDGGDIINGDVRAINGGDDGFPDIIEALEPFVHDRWFRPD